VHQGEDDSFAGGGRRQCRGVARVRHGLGGLELVALEEDAHPLGAVDVRWPDQPALASELLERDVVARGEGPMSMTYRGEVQIVDRDERERRATMHVKAKEARGQGTADAHVHMSLAEEPAGTEATIETEVQLSGKIAAMGQSVIGDVSAKLIETFAENLAAMLSDGGTQPSEVPGAAATAAGLAGSSSTTVAAPAVAPPGAPRRASPPQSALPAGKIAAAVIAGRLARPRTLLTVTVVFAVVFLAIGFLIGRAT
jgi:carbon monoxide dehydrogenase subunit G